MFELTPEEFERYVEERLQKEDKEKRIARLIVFIPRLVTILLIIGGLLGLILR